MSKHTPGPWICHLGRPESDPKDACRCHSVLAEPYMGSIAVISVDNGKKLSEGGNDNPPEGIARANARLIAAAPDMYELLKALADRLYTDRADGTGDLSNAARQILSRIEGDK